VHGGSSIVGRVGLGVLAILPPSVAGVQLRPEIVHHPIAALALLVSYEMAVVVVAFTGKVFGDLQERWATLLADRLDRTARGRFSRFERRYRQYMAMRHKFTDLKGLATRGDHTPGLEDVFVDVSLVPKPAHEIKRGSLAGAPLPDELLDASASVVPPAAAERRSLRAFLDGSRATVLAVIGPPGTGKTTLLEHTTLRLAKEGGRRSGQRNVPVLLFLRDHARHVIEDQTVGIADRIRAGLTGLIANEPPCWIEEQLGKGRCVVMLDGLDEVAGEQDRMILVAWVERQIARYPDNHWILTSRPHGYLSAPLNSAVVLQVRRFTSDQISHFLHGWYQAIERIATGQDDPALRQRAQEEAEDLLGRLRARPMLYDLAANPLLLTMIANVHRYRGALPGSRAELYAEICQVLLWRRQEAKSPHLSAAELSGVKKESVLRELAFRLMSSRIRDLAAEEAEEFLRAPLNRVGSELPAREFLEVVSASGLMVEREFGVYAFAHQTFQEYLAAAHLQDSGDLAPLVRAAEDTWWRETALLWAARTDPSPVIEECLRRGSIDGLSLAFDCLDEAAEVDPAMRRRLEDLRLESLQAPSGSARRRLMTGVTLARHFRDVVRLTDDALVCARPVSESVYRLFLAENRQFTAFGRPLRAADDSQILDVSGEAAARLVSWVNDVIGGESRYRLLRRTEAADTTLASLVGSARRYAIWTVTDEPFLPPTLYDPTGTAAVAPWSTSPARLRARTLADLDTMYRAARGLVFEFACAKAQELLETLSLREHAWYEPVTDQSGVQYIDPSRMSRNEAATLTQGAIEALAALRTVADDLPLQRTREIADSLCRACDLATELALFVRDPYGRWRTDAVVNLRDTILAVQRAADLLTAAAPVELEPRRQPNTLDLARVRGLRAGTLTDIHGATRRTAAYALRCLRHTRETVVTPRMRSAGETDASALLDTLLDTQLPPLGTTSPRDLRRALAAVRAAWNTEVSDRMASHPALSDIDGLVTGLGELSRAVEDEPSLDRSNAAACLRFGALALATVADRYLHNPDLVTACRTVASCVTVLQDRAEGVTPPCEAVLLVRV
jgi:NACHT domain